MTTTPRMNVKTSFGVYQNITRRLTTPAAVTIVRHLAPIFLIARTASCLMVHPGVPATDIKGIVFSPT
jgi:hypothetical protein